MSQNDQMEGQWMSVPPDIVETGVHFEFTNVSTSEQVRMQHQVICRCSCMPH
jgi:hypothetical protein